VRTSSTTSWAATTRITTDIRARNTTEGSLAATRAPIGAPITPPMIRSSASTTSTVPLVTACRKVTLAATNRIWKLDVPMTTAVGMPSR